jgi:hypothetical protein
VLRTAILAAWLLLAATVAALLGDAEPTRSTSTTIAFAARTVAGSNLYVMDARAATTRTTQVPEAARLVTSHSGERAPDAIESLAWSPDGQRILYLLNDASGEYPNYERRIDLWSVNRDGSEKRLLQRDFVPLDVAQSRSLTEFIEWDGNGTRYRVRRTLPPPREAKAFGRNVDLTTSPDGAMAAYREWGIDSNWICVAAADAVEELAGPAGATGTRFGCFGDGFFTRPEWAPR